MLYLLVCQWEHVGPGRRIGWRRLRVADARRSVGRRWLTHRSWVFLLFPKCKDEVTLLGNHMAFFVFCFLDSSEGATTRRPTFEKGKTHPARAVATTRIARGTTPREKTRIVFWVWFFPLRSARPVNNMRTRYVSYSLSARCTFSKNWTGPQKIFLFFLFSFVFPGCEFSGKLMGGR
jgi:hypothetical protein